MKKYIYILLCLLYFNVAIEAQMGQDPKAKIILDDIKSNYDNYDAVQMNFTLTLELPEQAPEVQQGVAIQSGDKYKMELDDQAIYSDGTAVWVHLKGNNEVQINDIDIDDSEMMSPTDILKVYESGEYEYAITNTFKEKGVSISEIEFKPTDEDSEYSKMRLTVHSKDNDVKSFKIFSRDGSRYTLDIHEIVTDKVYPADTFVFDASQYEDIYIEDLRID